MTLVYILSGILLLGALSYLGIRREKQERLRFEREELARLEGAGRADDPSPAGTLPLRVPGSPSTWAPTAEIPSSGGLWSSPTPTCSSWGDRDRASPRP